MYNHLYQVQIGNYPPRQAPNKKRVVRFTVLKIKKGTDELFILKKVNQPPIQCKNGIEIHVEEKLKVKISFRQVSHIKKVTNGLSFFFSAFVNNKLDACYEIEIEKVKVAKCKFLMDFHLNF